VLDVRNFCTPELQASIATNNNALEEEREAKEKASKPDAAAGASSEPMETDETSSSADATATASVATPVEPSIQSSYDCKTGRYELFGIITHQGRTAEGGHYVAWVKRDSKKWLVFDDEVVAEIDAERIKELYGGGDYHIAYMCLYRKMETLSLD